MYFTLKKTTSALHFLLNRFIILLTIHYSPPALSCLQSMLWIKLPFRKRVVSCESWCKLTIQRDHNHCGKQKTCTCGVCEHVCMHVWCLGDRGYSGMEWGHIHAWGEKMACAVGSTGQWTSVSCSCQQPHSSSPPPPTFLNYTIVLSHSILPRLVRHHLLSPQKAL